MNNFNKKVCSDVGNKIKELRKNRNLTQLELSDELGFTRSMVAQHELGLVNMPQSALEKYASFFNVSVDNLLGLEKTSNSAFSSFEGVQFTEDEKKEISAFINFLLYKRGSK